MFHNHVRLLGWEATMKHKEISDMVHETVGLRKIRQRTRGALIDRFIESSVGARPSDEYTDDKPEGDGSAPIAANMETGEEPGADLGVDTVPIETPEVDLSFESLTKVAQEHGLKVFERDGFDSIDQAALQKGVEVEKEHTDDPLVAAVIAVHHTLEIPDYYDRLSQMEAEAKGEQDDSLTGGEPKEKPAEEPEDSEDSEEHEDFEDLG
jgi:hypothetical protein